MILGAVRWLLVPSVLRLSVIRHDNGLTEFGRTVNLGEVASLTLSNSAQPSNCVWYLSSCFQKEGHKAG